MQRDVDQSILNVEEVVRFFTTKNFFANIADIEFVLLGGSIVNNTNGWWSDVDVFVNFRSNSDILTNPNLRYDFITELSISIEKEIKYSPVQISIFNKLPLLVKSRVLRNHKLLYTESSFKEEDLADLIALTISQAIDFEIFQNKWLDQSIENQLSKVRDD